MTDSQWNQLLAVLRGEPLDPLPVGFIIDSPWLPQWCGHDIADYLTCDATWWEDNQKAIEAFPDVWFLPGFWSEFGMGTEPSAFGARCRFPRNEFPFAEKVINDVDQIGALPVPDPATDGLLPFMLGRLRWARPRIEALGHKIRFSVSRGPLNIASFLMGTPEFLLALKTDPEPMRRLLRVITDFLVRWHALQRETFPTIAGIMVLDDLVGFMGEADFLEFGQPYLRDLFAVDVPVKFFHNDAPCAASLAHYADLGINLYNPGIQTTLPEMRRLSGGRLTILGNIAPRDVLAQGSPDEVQAAIKRLLEQTPDRSRLILSCAGGMPPGVSTENLRAFCEAAEVHRMPSAKSHRQTMRIDSHQHFWQYNPAHQVWMTDAMAVLRRDYLPDELKPLLQAIQFAGTIAVQARQMIEETEWLLELSDQHALILGVVGWVDLRSPNLRPQLEKYSRHRKLVGVRHVVHDEPDDGFMLRPEFRRGIAQLREFNLTYDLLLFPKHLPVAVQLVTEFPNQPFVLDHIAKPGIREGRFSPWREDLKRLAEFPNVFCKLSGLVTEAKWQQWRPEDFHRYLDVVIAAFGTDRVMIGSDWPVCTLSGDYASTMRIVMEYVQQFSANIRDDILGNNCARFYHLENNTTSP